MSNYTSRKTQGYNNPPKRTIRPYRQIQTNVQFRCPKPLHDLVVFFGVNITATCTDALRSEVRRRGNIYKGQRTALKEAREMGYYDHITLTTPPAEPEGKEP